MVELQAPEVHFAPGFMRRIEQFAPRIAAARQRREGAGGAELHGAGLEFEGHRPYRAGDDPRLVDWSLLARDERPFVRILRREASERWAIVVDTSGSMGVGPPGKLQSAAEVALALAAVGVRARASVSLHLTAAGSPTGDGNAGALSSVVMRRVGDLAQGSRLLSSAVARAGADGLAGCVARGVVPEGAGRVIVLGDLWDTAPEELLRLQRRGRELIVGRVFAPLEFEPKELGAGAVRLVDPEGSGGLEVQLTDSSSKRYGQLLEAELEGCARAFARRRVRQIVWRSDAPFEDPARALIGG